MSMIRLGKDPQASASPEELQRDNDSMKRNLQRLQDELEEKASILALVNGTLRSAISGHPLPEILKGFASNLKTVCPCDSLSISFFDSEKGTFHTPYMATGGIVSEAKGSSSNPAPEFLKSIVESGQSKRVSRRKAPRGGLDTRFIRKGFGCEMSVPLIADGKPFAVLNLACYEPDKLSERHVKLIEELVPPLTVTIWHYLSRRRFIYL